MGRRILVADDSSTIQKVIKIAFARFAVEIIEAGSFIEALTAVGRATPDALIIDASLPGARGPQDFAKLRSDSSGAPLLLLVGTYESVDEGSFRQAGLQEFLKKPFESSDIVQVVDRLLGGELTGEAGDALAPGPIVPPLPGSTNRSQHTTVFHPGGLEAMRDPRFSVPPPRDSRAAPPMAREPEIGPIGDDDLPGPPGVPPPPPMVDQTRKGRRAFDEGRPGGMGVVPPPPPASLSLDDEDTGSGRAAHLPPPPPMSRNTYPPPAPGQSRSTYPPEPPRMGRARGGDPGFMGLPDTDPTQPESGRRGPASGPQFAPLPDTGARRGQDTDSSLDLSLDEAQGGYMPPAAPSAHADYDDHDDHDDHDDRDGPSPRAAAKPGRPAAAAAGVDGRSLEALKAALEEQLPVLVRQAVEDYCERHFKSLAREIIASELRRLADEKARHLVDN